MASFLIECLQKNSGDQSLDLVLPIRVGSWICLAAPTRGLASTFWAEHAQHLYSCVVKHLTSGYRTLSTYVSENSGREASHTLQIDLQLDSKWLGQDGEPNISMRVWRDSFQMLPSALDSQPMPESIQGSPGGTQTASNMGHQVWIQVRLAQNLPNLGLQIINKIPGFCVFFFFLNGLARINLSFTELGGHVNRKMGFSETIIIWPVKYYQYQAR